MSPTEEDEKKPIIGIFDSGVGGFTVLDAVRLSTPASIIYFGDCARAPYGNRQKEEIVSFIKEIISHLKSKGVTHFISACNSMSVMTTDLILKEFDIPSRNYIDMLRACMKNCRLPKDSKVLVIGTQATIDSGAYQEVLKEKDTEAHEYVFGDLAKKIEDGSPENILLETIEPSISHAKELGITHILYGCTHYPLLDGIFKKCADALGWEGSFINPAMFVKLEVMKWSLQGENHTAFETSMHTKMFDTLARRYIR